MFTCQMLEYLHPHTSHCGSCPAGSCCRIPRPSTCPATAVLRWQRGSAVLSSQPRTAGPAARSCSSTAPGRAASSHAPPPWARCPESTSHSRGRSVYRVPGCPSWHWLWICGDRTSPRRSGSAAHLAAGRWTAGCSMAVADSGRRGWWPWRAVQLFGGRKVAKIFAVCGVQGGFPT
jgi:hypothetical protein